ncbi:M4 family metallopeptidase [Dactylosporangium darangshiense]|uniref:Zn-dependent metalloprotease n=1 Tax=Dactylosporangium darangshiense TaxID=579108 RepID=A0ABP8DDJ1_9ACTN
MKLSPRFATAAGVFAVGLVTTGTAVAVQASPPSPSAAAEVSNAAAAQAVDSFVQGKPSVLQPSTDDAYVQRSVTASGNAKYIAYERTYKGLPVRGGDFVVVTDKSGAATYTSVSQTKAIGSLSTTAKVSAKDAEAVARKQLTQVNNVEGTQLVVYTLDGAAKLAYETTLSGTGAEGASRLTVDVDALSGAVLKTTEHVTHGTGTGWINGSVSINTTLSGSTYRMQDPSITSLACQDAANNTTFSGSDDVWGNGTGTNRETGCVDALYVAQKEVAMLSSWLGRNGMNGSGGAWPIRVGLNDQNAYYDGTQVQIGKNTAGQWIASADVVGHEMGHGIDDTTPGGISNGNTQEFVADTFGAATEWFANNPNDPPDFLVGEEVNLVGSGPIRNMYNPSALGDDNCYSSSIPSEEVHAAAGPGNHWFYLLSQGTSGNGQPASSTCNSSTVTGLGIQTAIKIMYNAMLMKTSSSSYLKYRTWTLTAAKNLFPGSCTQFNTVKAAWDAVSVPAQSGDPTCTGGTTPPPTTTPPTSTPPTGGCSGQKLLNPGFESGATSWSGTTGSIGQWASQGQAAHGGTYSSWLDGYGTTHTEAIQQSVTIPAGCTATLTFYVHIDSAETTTTVQYDKLTVTAGTTTLGTLSNLNKASGYQLKSFSLNAFAGQTVTIKFSGSEDSSLQTSFVIDDTAVTLS